MLSAQKAFTLEADDVEAAVAEIIEQLDLESLGANTLGFVSGLPDYLEGGVIAALQEALPFDIIGQTSVATATPGSDDLNQLSLLVLSGDDVAFSTSLSEPISGGEDGELLKTAYAAAAASRADEPAFILMYAPLLYTASGDFFVKTTDAASGGVALFGSVASDNTLDYHESQTVYKGEGYRNRTVYVLFYGSLSPRFYLAGITHGKVFNETGVVTSSEGSQLQTINNAPVSEFLKSLGLSTNENGEFVSINSFPYVVDYNDGTDPVIRVMFAITPEGYAVCGGDIPVGATLGVSYFDAGEILESSKNSIDRLAQDIAENGAQVMLVFSCIGRYFSLGYDTDAEVRLFHDALDASGVPYTYTYSGGEICPSPSKNDSGAWANRAHNSTFVVIAL
jgi:hypothetical protein